MVFDLNRFWDKGKWKCCMEHTRHWLRALHTHARGAQFAIVGTHLDEFLNARELWTKDFYGPLV